MHIPTMPTTAEPLISFPTVILSVCNNEIDVLLSDKEQIMKIGSFFLQDLLYSINILSLMLAGFIKGGVWW